jgi:hypothetical protein
MCGSPDTSIDPTPEEIVAVQKDVELWNYYQDSFKPLIDKYISLESTPEKEEAEKKAVAGEIKAETMKMVDPSKVSPNPVENVKKLSDIASLTSAATVKGEAAERGRYLGSLEDIINIGRGQETAAMGSLQSLAQTATQKEVAEKQMKLEKATAMQSSQQSAATPCCFIFLASELDNELLDYVKQYKDSHFKLESDVALGYKRLAIWIVPKMRKNEHLKNFVKAIMCKPMAIYAKAFYENDLLKQIDLYPLVLFWGLIFGITGKLYGEKGWERYWKLTRCW